MCRLLFLDEPTQSASTNESPMRRLRSVKIVATLGPASDDYQTIRQLFSAGADVFRLNMSHGSHDDVARRHSIIRQVEQQTGRPIGILADLQGPKLRCGEFRNGSEQLVEGQQFRLDLDPAPGDSERVNLPHIEIFQALRRGATLLVNDGLIRLDVIEQGADFAKCRVVKGGVISARKGVNVPDITLPLAALSDKDKTDLEFVCSLGVDWLALSFVQRAEDVEEARDLASRRAAIMSKIEKPAAVEALQPILDASDGIMVARGDLGVETPLQNLPPIQKRLIRRARYAAKPVIVATQMLESMVTNAVPTRAEISDVATAIYEGADAVMLSAESAAGKFPIESVATMDSVAVAVENDITYREIIEASRRGPRGNVPGAITGAAREIAETTEVKSVCCFTHSGTTARLMARERPCVPTIVLTPFDTIARRLSLLWGAHCVVSDLISNFDQAVACATEAARQEGFGFGDDQIIIIAGVPFRVSGSTNIIRIASIGEE